MCRAYLASTCVKLRTVTRSVTLLQFGGASQKLALTVAKGLQRFKE